MRRHLLAFLGALILALAGAVLAPATGWAYFDSQGSGTTQAPIGTLGAPSGVTVLQTGSSVTLNWSAATLSNGAAVDGYVVTRSDGVVVCGASTPVTATSCTAPAPSAGSVTYTVAATYRSFTTTLTSSPITTLTAPTLSSAPSSVSAALSPSFTVSGGGAGSYQCSLDSAAFSSCASTVAYSSLSAGSHTFAVRAVSGASVGPTATDTWTIDAAAPSLGSIPSALSASASATLAFSGPESSYGDRCQLDGGGFSACTSPVSYTGLADGTHTFTVEAVSPDGAVTATSTASWQIDTTPPTSTITFPGAAASVNASGFAAGCTAAPYAIASGLCGTAADSGSGVARVLVSVQQGSGAYWNGTSFTAGSEVRLSATGTTTWTLGLAATALPADGSYTVRVYAVDRAGNVQATPTTSTFVLDTTPPAIAIAKVDGLSVLGLTNLVNLSSLGGSCGVASGDLPTVAWSIARSSIVVQSGTTSCSSGTWNVTLPTVIATSGSYAIQATQADQAGNIGAAGQSVTVGV